MPKEYIPTVFEIKFEQYYSQGYRSIIFDIDNTLAPNNIPKPTMEIINLIHKLKSIGFNMCLLSNNNEERVSIFNAELDLITIPNAKKPGLSGINKALNLLGTKDSQTIMVGDQIFTDIWCGNRLGIHTILVEPLSLTEEFLIKLKRILEKIVMAKYKRKLKKR